MRHKSESVNEVLFNGEISYFRPFTNNYIIDEDIDPQITFQVDTKGTPIIMGAF